MIATEAPVPADGWVVTEVSYVDPAREFCAFCGRPLTRRFWRAFLEGTERRYCEPLHAEMDGVPPVNRPG
jgi:hypothetical protein